MNTVADTPIARKVARILLSIRAVTINTKKPYRYVSGMLAPLYTDNRLLISHPDEWNVIINSYLAVMEKSLKNKPAMLSGTATAAIPHAAVLSYRLKIPMVYVRSAKKEHGKDNLIEGESPKKKTVLIVEDLVSTGKSIAVNVGAVRAAGGVVHDCLAITTSTKAAFAETVKSLKIRLMTLTSIEIIIDEALRGKYISKKAAGIVRTFLDDPKGWGRKRGFE